MARMSSKESTRMSSSPRASENQNPQVLHCLCLRPQAAERASPRGRRGERIDMVGGAYVEYRMTVASWTGKKTTPQDYRRHLHTYGKS